VSASPLPEYQELVKTAIWGIITRCLISNQPLPEYQELVGQPLPEYQEVVKPRIWGETPRR
jgi:hypothetical protein